MGKQPLLKDYLLRPDATIRDAVRRIDRGASQTALVVDGERLAGSGSGGGVGSAGEGEGRLVYRASVCHQ